MLVPVRSIRPSRSCGVAQLMFVIRVVLYGSRTPHGEPDGIPHPVLKTMRLLGVEDVHHGQSRFPAGAHAVSMEVVRATATNHGTVYVRVARIRHTSRVEVVGTVLKVGVFELLSSQKWYWYSIVP